MDFSFIAQPLREAVEKAIALCGGTLTHEGNRITVHGNYGLIRALLAIASAIAPHATRAGITIHLLDTDVNATAGVIGEDRTTLPCTSATEGFYRDPGELGDRN